jgi:hypothetical protein
MPVGRWLSFGCGREVRAVLSNSRTIQNVLDADYLQIRARILELAAALDRLDRAAEPPGCSPDRRLATIRIAIEALAVPEHGRAETIQRLFSLDYDSKWRETFGLISRPRT